MASLRLRTALAFGLVCAAATAHAQSSALARRSYPTSGGIAIVGPERILDFNSNTRAIRPVILEQSSDQEQKIAGYSFSEGVLTIRTTNGLYVCDMNRGAAVEAVGLKDSTSCAGAVAADIDYIWHACGDTLRQFDRLGREWMAFAMPPEVRGTNVMGCMYDGNNLYAYFEYGVAVFSAFDEKWRVIAAPHQRIQPRAIFFQSGPAGCIVDDQRLLRYLPEDESFQVFNLAGRPRDIDVFEHSVFYATHNKAFHLDFQTGITRELKLPRSGSILALCRISSTRTAVVAAERLLLYDSNEQTAQQVAYPMWLDGAPAAVAAAGNLLVFVTHAGAAVYDRETRIWESLAIETATKAQAVQWNDNGFKIRYGNNSYSELAGVIEYTYPMWDTFVVELDSQWIRTSTITGDGDTVRGWGWNVRADTLPATGVKPLSRIAPEAAVVFHTQLQGERYLDAFFDNTSLTRTPRKGLSYTGARDDMLESAQLGDVTLEIPELQTIPAVKAQGVQARGGSSARLSTRDRRRVRLLAGGGYQQSRSVYEALAYQPGGVYRVGQSATPGVDSSSDESDTTRIAPGSLALYIDGERVDSSDFTFIASTGRLLLNRPDLADPFSVITVSYSLETIPDSGITAIELVPTNSFSQTGMVSALASASSWLSARASYAAVRPDTLNHLISLALPGEFRSQHLLLKYTPEFTYNATGRTQAAGLDLTSRIGSRATFELRGLTADSAYHTTDIFSRGYGATTRDVEARGAFDLNRDITLHSSYRATEAVNGAEDRYSLGFDLSYASAPDFSLTIARNAIDAVVRTTRPGTIIDSSVDSEPSADAANPLFDTAALMLVETDTLDVTKTKLRARIYDAHSHVFEERLGFHRATYDFAATEYWSRDRRTEASGNGRILFGKATLAPSSALTFTGAGTYSRNPAGPQYSRRVAGEIQAQTLNAPPGADIHARYAIDVGSLSGLDSSSATTVRSIHTVLVPGVWFAWAKWFSPRFSLEQSLVNDYRQRLPGPGQALAGNQGIRGGSLAKTAGLQFSPTLDILLLSLHTWTDNQHIRDRFSSFNDLRLYANGKKDVFQMHYELYRFTDSLGMHSGFAQYDRTWLPWLTTLTGIRGEYQRGEPGSEARIGPAMRVRISRSRSGRFKRLRHDQECEIYWMRKRRVWRSCRPDIHYAAYLQASVRPNVSVSGSGSFVWAIMPADQMYALDDFSVRVTFGAHF